MKKRSIILLLISLILLIALISSVNFVSASWFSDVWGKITGKAVEANGTIEENVIIEPVTGPVPEPPRESIQQVCCKIIVAENRLVYKWMSVTDCPPVELAAGTSYGRVNEEYCREKIPCTADVKKCPDGSYVSRNPENNCEFYLCPEKTEPTIESIPVSVPKPEPVPVQICAAKIKISLDKEVYYIGDNAKVRVEIFDEQGNFLPNYLFYGQTYDGEKWQPPSKEVTGRDGSYTSTGVIKESDSLWGKVRFRVFTEMAGCGLVEDILDAEIKKGREKEEICGIGVCVPEEEEIREVEYIPEAKKEKILYSCTGCELNNKCYPLGYREEGKYCSIDYEFVAQKERGECDNNFECSSNVCISGECISENLVRRIINWFKKLFGQEEPREDEKAKSEFCSKLLIEKDIENYKYNQSKYGENKDEQAPLYSSYGEQIGVVKCCAASYGEGMALVCPFDNREDIHNSINGLSARGEIYLEEYKGRKLYKLNGKRVIIWANDKYIIAVGSGPNKDALLLEYIVDAYLEKYPSDLETELLEKTKEAPVKEIPVEETVKEPLNQPPSKITEGFIEKIEKLGIVTLIDFETLADKTVLVNGARLTGKEWESLGVIFETPSEEYLKVFGPNYPFNPLDKLSLSPGLGPFEDGSETHDDLTITFSKPVKAVGIYLLDLGETDERESISFLDKDGNVIEKISPWPGSTFGNPAPGTFVNLIHEGISKIEILENTRDGDDIAYDNLYFVR